MLLLGATKTPGLKTVTVQVRDRALNGSAFANDSITYMPLPTLTSMSSTSVTVVNETRIRLTGTGFANAREARQQHNAARNVR